MGIYIVYFFLILIVPSVCSFLIKNRRNAQDVALKILLFLMYLILALKSETVGSDISGYREMYVHYGSVPFNDFSYSSMEIGYIFLMKLGNIIGLSFQGFEAVLYAITIIPMYYFIKRNSCDVMISVLILFCLDFFVFACSGLRQTVAMSMCVGSFTYLTNKKNSSIHGFNKLILAIIIVGVASFIHRSSLLFIPVLLIVYYRFKVLTYALYAVVVLILLFVPHYFININAEYELSKYELDERLTLGMMFVFDVIMIVFYYISIRINKISIDKISTWQFGNVILYGLLLMVVFNGSMILRAALYELVFFAIIMPIAIHAWEQSTRRIISFIYVAVMFFCLYFLILKPNTLSIVPYRFFFS